MTFRRRSRSRARMDWKFQFEVRDITELSDGALNSIIEFAGKLPSPNCEILIALIAGAANRVPMDAMARPREAKRENTRCGL